MVFKINIGTKEGKTYKTEVEAPALIGKELYDKVSGKEIPGEFEGYEFEITGASDTTGFPSIETVEGIGTKKELLTYGKGLHKRPKGDKKFGRKTKGLRYRKSVRGKVISPSITQINLKLTKEGNKKLSEIFSTEKTEEKKE